MGRFISFEGGEGCGKTTHIALLAQRLNALGIETILTREPGGTPLCEAVRGLLQFDTAGEPPCPEAEALLFCASRAQLVRNVIRPALARGAWVLCDRFADSTLAYQGYGRGFDLASLRSLLAFATGGLSPDVTFLLEASLETRNDRLDQRYGTGVGADRFEREEDDFHRRVRLGFEELADAAPARIVRIPTERPVADTAAAIWREALRRFSETLQGRPEAGAV
ncbi:MAG: dTMP kinase [Kiritimatiellae bacterium]|nr:dTMP kinase [Kiritimatiellia bacterium]